MVFQLSYYNEIVEAELDAWPVDLRARSRALTVRMEKRELDRALTRQKEVINHEL